MRKVLGTLVGLGLLLTATVAAAQQPTDTTQTPPPGTGTDQSVQTLPPPRPAATATVSTTTTTTEGAKKDDGITDHEKVVGKFGVMYFGVTQQPLGTGAANAVGRGAVSTPVIGVRYWLQERLGIDAGIGFNMFSSGRSVETAGVTRDADGPAAVAFTLHGGLPLAFAYGKHYKFLLVPELNVGYATQTEASQPGAPVTPDVHRTGFRFDVGARVGTEIQFGFIGIPELALQASVGLNFRRQVWHASQDAGNGVAASSSSEGQTNFGTTVQSDPWALFVNNISAIYYFP